ncbi:hypothetical protein IW262DRAFT_1536005 [Armillaria fumosa]|nr:hypothetical protein IW262DRAFT_1536005 [Armillaria fumosa]
METEGVSWEDEDDEQNLAMTNQSSSEISIQAPVPQHHASSSQQTCPRWLDPTLEEEYIVPAQPQRLQQSVMAHASLSPAPRSQLLPDPFLDSGQQTQSSSRSNHSDRSTPFMSTPSASSQFIRSKAVLERENKELRCELGQVKAQRDAAETHAVFASRQAAIAQYKLNKSKEKAAYKSMCFPTSSRLVTSEKGRSEAKEYEETRQRKLDAAEKKKRDRKAKEHDDLIRRSTQVKTMTFTGSLSSKNKTELGDLAAALDIPSEGLTVIKLREDISQYFMDHPEMKLDERYSGIYTRSRKRPAPMDNGDDLTQGTLISQADMPPPLAQRLRHDTPAPQTYASYPDQQSLSNAHTYAASSSHAPYTGMVHYQAVAPSSSQPYPLRSYYSYAQAREFSQSQTPTSSASGNDVRGPYLYPSSHTYHQ